MLCKIVITLVSTRNRHNGSCAITCQHIISNPDWNRFFCKRMFGISTCKRSRNGFYICHPISFATFCSGLNIGLDLCFLIRCGDFQHQFMFWGKRHKTYSENGVRSCCEDFDFMRCFDRLSMTLFFIFCRLLRFTRHDVEGYRSTNRFPNPITLTFFKGLCPIYRVQSLQ